MNFLMRVAALVCAGFAIPLAAQTYRISRRAPIGGEGKWAYLTMDSDARRIFIPRDNHVTVLDCDTLKVVGEIPNTPGAQSIAFSPELGRGYISNGNNDTVTVFDRKTIKPLGTVRVGDEPNGITYSRGVKRVLTANEQGRSVTAFDPATGAFLGSVALGGKPHALIPDARGHVFVNVSGKDEIVLVDPVQLTVMSRWPLAPGRQPRGMSFDYKSQRLFIACENRRLIVMDSTNGKIVAVLPVGAGADALRWDPDARMLFSANSDGTLSIFHQDTPDKYTLVQSLPTMPGARTLTLDRKTHRLFTVATRYDKNAKRPVPGSFEVLVIEKSQN